MYICTSVLPSISIDDVVWSPLLAKLHLQKFWISFVGPHVFLQSSPSAIGALAPFPIIIVAQLPSEPSYHRTPGTVGTLLPVEPTCPWRSIAPAGGSQGPKR